MAAELELESLVVHLLGDAASYNKMMDEAVSKVQDTASKATRAAEGMVSRVKASLMSMFNMFKQVGTNLSLFVTAPILAMSALAVRAFIEDEVATKKLGAALAANGRDVARLMPIYQAFATEMQRVTVFADEQVVSMLQLAESFGVTGDKAMHAVKNAIAMSAAFGIGAESATRLAVQLEHGDAQMLARYIPSLKGIKDKALRAAKAQEILTKAFGVATGEITSGQGAIKNMMNLFSDLQEMFGEIIVTAVMPFMGHLRSLINWFKALSPQAKQIIVIIAAIAAAAGPALIVLGTLGSALVSIGTAIAAIGTTGGLIIGLIVTGFVQWGAIIAGIVAMLWGPQGFVSAWQAIKSAASTAFTTVLGFMANFQHNIGAIVTWVRDNWKQMVMDMLMHIARLPAIFLGNITVALNTAARLWIAWKGYVLGLLKRLFTVETLQMIVSAAVRWLEVVIEFGEEAAKALHDVFTGAKSTSVSDFVAKLGKDFEAGMKDQNFATTAMNIIKDEMKNVRSPLEGFETKLLPPDIRLKIEAAAQATGQSVQAGVVAPVMEATKEVAKLGTKVKDLTTDLQTQVATFGMTSGEVEVYKLQLAGATKEQLASANAAALQLKALEQNKKIKEATQDLQAQAMMYGKSTNQLAVYKLAQEGATKAQIAAAQAAANQLDLLEKEKDRREKAIQLAEKYLTPLEKHRKTEAELIDLRKQGLISVEAFTLAMQESIKDIAKEHHISFKTTGLDAAEAGTAQAIADLNAFRDAATHGVQAAALAKKAAAAVPIAAVVKKPAMNIRDQLAARDAMIARANHGPRIPAPPDSAFMRPEVQVGSVWLNPGAAPDWDKILEELHEVNENTKELAQKTTVSLEPANL